MGEVGAALLSKEAPDLQPSGSRLFPPAARPVSWAQLSSQQSSAAPRPSPGGGVGGGCPGGFNDQRADGSERQGQAVMEAGLGWKGRMRDALFLFFLSFFYRKERR